jgi:hypothetical protein
MPHAGKSRSEALLDFPDAAGAQHFSNYFWSIAFYQSPESCPRKPGKETFRVQVGGRQRPGGSRRTLRVALYTIHTGGSPW